jgi:hypothetical protein
VLLAAHTAYRLRIERDGDASIFPPGGATFTTGGNVRDVAAHIAANFTLFEAEYEGQSNLELLATGDAAEPFWIIAKGYSGGGPVTMVSSLGGGFSGAGFQPDPLDMPLGPVACADVEIVDATGATVRTESLCEPSGCEVDPGISSCIGNPQGGWQSDGLRFTAIGHPGRCGDAATSGGSSAGSKSGGSSGGCGVARGTRRSSSPERVATLIVGAAWAVRCRRPRRGRRF